VADPTRGITSSDLRRVVREALRQGWRWGGFTGTTHARIVWKTGELVTFGTTPSVASWKTTASEIERISGVVVWRKGNHKRSHKSIKPSGFSLDAAHRECASWHGVHDDDIDRLREKRDELIASCQRFARSRHTLHGIPKLLDRIDAIERRLRSLGQDVDSFDPFSLADSETS
jgi:hypothetical protein